jgi:outer membrane protein
MRLKSLVVAMAAVASLAPIAAHAQAEENPWMIRVRAVYTDWQNGQSGNASSLNLTAKKEWIPEFDVSYFFTKNIATELVLTYPQNVDVYAGAAKAGTIKALPPSLLLQYHFTDLGSFKPYVGAGVNYTLFSNTSNFPLVSNGLTVSSSSFGFAGQIGADYMFDKNWGVNVDVKYITMATNTNSNGAAGNLGTGKLTLNPWTPAIGVTYKF